MNEHPELPLVCRIVKRQDRTRLHESHNRVDVSPSVKGSLRAIDVAISGRLNQLLARYNRKINGKLRNVEGCSCKLP